MSQNISSAEIAAVNPDLDVRIRRIGVGLSRISDQLCDYSIRIVFEAYEITGIWIDSVWLCSSVLSRPICMFSLYHLEGVQEYGTLRIEYLSRDDTHVLKPLLKSVRYQPAPC